MNHIEKTVLLITPATDVAFYTEIDDFKNELRELGLNIQHYQLGKWVYHAQVNEYDECVTAIDEADMILMDVAKLKPIWFERKYTQDLLAYMKNSNKPIIEFAGYWSYEDEDCLSYRIADYRMRDIIEQVKLHLPK